ncbi:MAG: signal peptidase I [Pseudomonadota bacterium]|nr:signal peptidase I [Pseudomonadota bacterium]
MSRPSPQDATSPSKHPWLTSELAKLAVMLLLLTAARASLANHYHVPSGSMEHSLMPGDRVVVDMTAYGLSIPFTSIDVLRTGEPARGDIAVFDSPLDGVRLIKRVVAVGGDQVTLVDGWLTINGRPMQSPGEVDVEQFGDHRAQLNLAYGGGPDIHAVIVPQGRVLVLGDSRGNSVDGRYFGLVPTTELYGRAIAIYYRRGEGLGWNGL